LHLLVEFRVYTTPFDEYSSENRDAHEALNASDYRMAVYGLHNEILLLEDEIGIIKH